MLAPQQGQGLDEVVRTGDGTPKLSQRAFRFPFVIESAGHGRFIWWTRVPVSGRISVQRRSSHGWRSVFGTLVRTHQVLERGAPSRLRRGADGDGRRITKCDAP